MQTIFSSICCHYLIIIILFDWESCVYRSHLLSDEGEHVGAKEDWVKWAHECAQGKRGNPYCKSFHPCALNKILKGLGHLL